VKGDEPVKAADEMLVYKNRIGAWTTLSSLNRILEALEHHGETLKMGDLLYMQKRKGLALVPISFEIVFRACVTKADRLTYDRVYQLAKENFSDETLAEFDSKYPSPPLPEGDGLSPTTDEANSHVGEQKDST